MVFTQQYFPKYLPSTETNSQQTRPHLAVFLHEVWHLRHLLMGHKAKYKISKKIQLVVSTPLKNMSQNGNLPQIGVKIKNIVETTT